MRERERERESRDQDSPSPPSSVLRCVYHLAAGRPGPGSVRFGRQICSAKLAARRSLRTNVGEHAAHRHWPSVVSKPLCLSVFPVSVPVPDPAVPPGYVSALPASLSCVTVVSDSPACSWCLRSPKHPGVPVPGAFYPFSFMCKRTAWTVKQLHLCVCVCVYLHAGQFSLLFTNSKLRLKVQMF